MNIISGDILNHNAELWLSEDYIRRATTVDADYLRVAKSRAKKSSTDTASWRHDNIQEKCYFRYTCVPAKYRAELPNQEQLLSNAVKPHDEVCDLVTDAQWNSFKQFLPQYANYTFAKSKTLAQSAAIIHEAKNYVEVKGLSYSKSAFFERLSRELELQQIKYLPKSWRNLRDKVKAYAQGEPITNLVSPKNEGNANTAKFINNDLINGWIIELADSQRNYSAAFIYRKIRLMSEQSGLDNHPSERWVSDYLAKPETKFLIANRYGHDSRFNQVYRGYTPTQSAIFAGDCWQIDGTRVNIIDHRASWTNKDGKRVSGQKFLYIIAVRDVMSGHILGWEYCYEESAHAVINAIAMAVRNTGYLPYELIYDRFPGHNSESWAWVEANMQREGVKMTMTHKAEGKANIERWWGTLQTVFMMESDLYYGEGVKSSRRYAHRAKEYVTEMRSWATKNGFDFDDACRESDKFIDNYVNRPYSDYSRKFSHIDQSPAQLHTESDKPNTYAVTEQLYCYMFGLRKWVSIRKYMIETQIEGATYYYGIDDCEVVEKYTSVKLLNCFDYEDLGRVHLYDGEKYLGTFAEIKPAQRFGPDKDMRAVGKTKAINEKMTKHRTERLMDIQNRKSDAVETRPATSQTESEEPVEITPELGMFQGGKLKKPVYEAAETAFLREEWGASEDDEEEIIISTKDQY
jgi:Integrase core domain.